MRIMRPITPPIGTVVRNRVTIGDGLFTVVGDFGPIGFEGECYAEIEPFPNVYDDAPTFVPAVVLVPADEY